MYFPVRFLFVPFLCLLFCVSAYKKKMCFNYDWWQKSHRREVLAFAVTALPYSKVITMGDGGLQNE